MYESGEPKVGRMLLSTLMAASLALMTMTAFGQTESLQSSTAAAQRYSPGSIKTLENADAALADVQRERERVNARYAAEELACHPRFFASSCIDDAKERRRVALQRLRAIEIEAHTFQRRMRVIERDEALEKRRAKEKESGSQAVHRNGEGAESKLRGTPAAEQRKNTGAADARSEAPQAQDRQARHAAKLRKMQDREIAEAAQREQNIASFARKQETAKQRQRQLEERRAEKARKAQANVQPPPRPGDAAVERGQ